ncbi:MAG: hypothetical protein HOM21_07245, partial [Halobacteriovoraceae bacterium]|nr:hypothetical protein [Halobacteriovoraceae bacterium]
NFLEKQLACSQLLVITEKNETDGMFRAQNTFNKINTSVLQCTPGQEAFCNSFQFDCDHGIAFIGGASGDLDGYFRAGDYSYTNNGPDLEFCLIAGGCGNYDKIDPPSL